MRTRGECETTDRGENSAKIGLSRKKNEVSQRMRRMSKRGIECYRKWEG
jgi:hypothetical protein